MTRYRITRLTQGPTPETLSGTAETFGEATIVLMNEARDLLDRGFKHKGNTTSPNGTTTTLFMKGRTSVTLMLQEVDGDPVITLRP
jgi:hypothetical protein